MKAFVVLAILAVASARPADLKQWDSYGPSGVVTAEGAFGPSGVVTAAGAFGPSGVVTAHGAIGPSGEHSGEGWDGHRNGGGNDDEGQWREGWSDGQLDNGLWEDERWNDGSWDEERWDNGRWDHGQWRGDFQWVDQGAAVVGPAVTNVDVVGPSQGNIVLVEPFVEHVNVAPSLENNAIIDSHSLDGQW